jgi:hypothetical protein
MNVSLNQISLAPASKTLFLNAIPATDQSRTNTDEQSYRSTSGLLPSATSQSRFQRRWQKHHQQRLDLLTDHEHFYTSRCLRCLVTLWMLFLSGMYVTLIVMTMQLDDIDDLAKTIGLYALNGAAVVVVLIWFPFIVISYLSFAI